MQLSLSSQRSLRVGLVVAAGQARAEAQNGRRSPSDLHKSPIGGPHVLTRPGELRLRGDRVFDGEELPGLVDAA
jgi:hypothetical protein